MNNAINWFEIPTSDFNRAVQFYSTILSTELKGETMGDMQMAIFPHDSGAVGGAIVAGTHYMPGATGTIPYLNATGILDAVLERIQHAGNTIYMPKTFLGEDIGYIALFCDSEGNTIGLHSPN